MVEHFRARADGAMVGAVALAMLAAACSSATANARRSAAGLLARAVEGYSGVLVLRGSAWHPGMQLARTMAADRL